MNTDKVKAALTRKLGPLPAWAWAGIAAVAFYIYQRRSGSTANTTAVANPANVPAFGQDPFPITGGSGSGGGSNGGGSGSGGGDGTGGGSGGGGAGTTPPGDTAPAPPPETPAGTGAAGGTAPPKQQHKSSGSGISKGISGKGRIQTVPRSHAVIHKGIAARGRVKAVPRTAKAAKPRGANPGVLLPPKPAAPTKGKGTVAPPKHSAPPAARKPANKRKVIKR